MKYCTAGTLHIYCNVTADGHGLHGKHPKSNVGFPPPQNLDLPLLDIGLYQNHLLQPDMICLVSGTRLAERLFEGPPTEDSVIDLEKQEETEEGFVKLFSRKVILLTCKPP